MKTLILGITAVVLLQFNSHAQKTTNGLEAAVVQLANAKTVSDYQSLANDFRQMAESKKTEWLPWYYAAFCNAKIGWLYKDDGDKIEPFTILAEEEIQKALSFLDTTNQKKELSEVYCVFSMLNRDKVYMNPATYGREYGPKASNYMRLARRADPENPRAIYLEGWEKFATPKAWGGDKSKAKELLTAAKQKLESNSPSGIEPHWGKTEVEELLKKLK